MLVWPDPSCTVSVKHDLQFKHCSCIVAVIAGQRVSGLLQLQPQALTENGDAYMCEHCGSKLLRSEALQKVSLCCNSGKYASYTLPDTPEDALAIYYDPAYPALSRSINQACTYACTLVQRSLTDHGKGFHCPIGEQMSQMRLEGTVMFFSQQIEPADMDGACASLKLRTEAAKSTLTQASKLWWVVSKPLPPDTADDLQRLIPAARAMLQNHHARSQLPQPMPVLPMSEQVCNSIARCFRYHMNLSAMPLIM